MKFKIFKNKKVLITGHTGFKGSWLAAWLHLLEAKIYGISIDPPSKPSHFEVIDLESIIDHNYLDIRDGRELSEKINLIEPDYIFHLAAQPIVKTSYEDPIGTYQSNLMGTLNLLESVRNLKKKCTVILITSDKSYYNSEWIWGYRENDRLGGIDPYSASKAATEIMIQSHIKSYFTESSEINIGIGRAGNVIGGGDWAESRIIPDCIRSWSMGKKLNIRNPYSTRPWQHVLEPLSGYLNLAYKLSENNKLHGEPFNFGPHANQNVNVGELIKEMSKYWKGSKFSVEKKNKNAVYESGLLKLNCDKALFHLDWMPTLDTEKTIELTINWYKSFYAENQFSQKTTFDQIIEYEAIAKLKNISWAM